MRPRRRGSGKSTCTKSPGRWSPRVRQAVAASPSSAVLFEPPRAVCGADDLSERWVDLDGDDLCVPGRDDRITYALGLNADGSIKAIEVLVCVAEYDQVRGDWRRNFVGRRFSRSHLGESIPNISGSTLSVAHMADGITRLLATHALFLAPGQG